MHPLKDAMPRPLTMAAADELIACCTHEISSTAVVREPLLSVCLLTYNQQQYIRQAVESALAQETDFPFEIVIGDDHSDDGTGDILRDLQRSHPEKIRLLQATENLGRHTGNGRLNMIRTLRACRGEFVAMLEGDDFWTAPQKLQRQVDALKAHREWAICFHSTHFFWDDGSQTPFDFPLEFDRPVSTVEHLIDSNFMQTCSVVFRNRLFGQFPEWFLEVGLGDWPLHILNSLHGDIGFLPETLAAYRVHSRGFWTSKSTEECDAIIRNFRLLLHRNLPRPLSDRAAERLVSGYADQIEVLTDACRDKVHSIDILRQHIEKLNEQHEQSVSLRLGRSLLAPLRAVRGLIRSGASAPIP